MAGAYGVKKHDWFIGIGCHQSLLIQVPPVKCKLPHISFCIPFLGVNGLWLGSLPTLEKAEAEEFNAEKSDDLAAKTKELEDERKRDDDELSDEEVQEIKDLTADLRRIPYVADDGLPLMGRTSDAGFIIPHISIPPNNAMLPLTILFGSSVQVLGASSKRVHCKNLLWGHTTADIATKLPWRLPIGLNLTCNDPLPILGTDIVFPASTNEVFDVKWSDFGNAMIDVFQECALACVMAVGGSAMGKLKKRFKVKPKQLFKGKSPVKYLNKGARAAEKAQDIDGLAKQAARHASGSKKSWFEIRLGGTNQLKFGDKIFEKKLPGKLAGRGHALKTDQFWRAGRLIKRSVWKPGQAKAKMQTKVDDVIKNTRKAHTGEAREAFKELLLSRNAKQKATQKLDANEASLDRVMSRIGHLKQRPRPVRTGAAPRRHGRLRPNVRRQRAQIRRADALKEIAVTKMAEQPSLTKKTASEAKALKEAQENFRKRFANLKAFEDSVAQFRQDEAKSWWRRYLKAAGPDGVGSVAGFANDVGLGFALGYARFTHTAGDWALREKSDLREPDGEAQSNRDGKTLM